MHILYHLSPEYRIKSFMFVIFSHLLIVISDGLQCKVKDHDCLSFQLSSRVEQRLAAIQNEIRTERHLVDRQDDLHSLSSELKQASTPLVVYYI